MQIKHSIKCLLKNHYKYLKSALVLCITFFQLDHATIILSSITKQPPSF